MGISFDLHNESRLSEETMSELQVYEDPWPRSNSRKPRLSEAAALHLSVSNFFLKLLPYFPHNEDGLITDEALAYSEWRYVVYIGCLHGVGLSPHEVPPPW